MQADGYKRRPWDGARLCVFQGRRLAERGRRTRGRSCKCQRERRGAHENNVGFVPSVAGRELHSTGAARYELRYRDSTRHTRFNAP